jgi:anti-sigma factor RsiW
MSTLVTDADLEGYFDEALPAEEMTRLEGLLRHDSALRQRLAELVTRRDEGLHSLGAIWRRHRLTCPSREQFGNYLLGTLDAAARDYLEFHLSVAGCSLCIANLADLRRQQAESIDATQSRRRKYFQSSAGYLRKP